jgi:hypothetical protein
MALSNTERIARGLLHHYLPDERFIFNVRPEWLVNPKTGNALELDIYCEHLKSAWEINGVQHGRFTPGLQKTEADFLKQLEHDMHKVNVCRERCIALYRLTIFDLTQARFEPFVKQFMKEHGQLEQFNRTTPPRTLYIQAERLSRARNVPGRPYRKPGLLPLLQRTWRRWKKGQSKEVYG